jgi:homoserine O-acetyltransferase
MVGIGGSMGGQQLLEWAIEEPQLFKYIFPIATNAFHSPWGIAFNASQRLAIEMDSSWKEDHPDAGINGMKVARGFALISYRHYTTYGKGQMESDDDLIDGFKSESYQRYQGEKLAKRFNAFSYYYLSKSMDSHNVGRSRGGLATALGRIRAATLVIGIETDILFPVEEQQFLSANIPASQFVTINSLYGHDGFLLEFDQLEKIIHEFIHNESGKE